MAVTAKDGSHHHSASRARLHDELAAKKDSAVTPIKKDSSDAGPGGMTHPAPTKTPIEEHVAEHGPAHSIMYHHDQDGDGMHHVSSFHGEAPSPYGKMAGGQNAGEGEHTGEGGGESAAGESHMLHPGAHHSRHKTHHAAHEHMGKAMGMDHEDEDRPEEADDETPDSQQDQTAGSRGIPGLS